MFQTRRIQVGTVQCMNCGRFRIDGEWVHADFVNPSEISHTFCPDCAPAVRERLRREHQFRHESFEHQISMLRDDLIRQATDESSLRDRLDFMNDRPEAVDALIRAVSDLLVRSQCRYCGREFQPGDAVTEESGYRLHEDCACRFRESIAEMRRLHAPAGKLDAYMDILNVPHAVRSGLRAEISRPR